MWGSIVLMLINDFPSSIERSKADLHANDIIAFKNVLTMVNGYTRQFYTRHSDGALTG